MCVSEQVLKVLLEELATARLICQQCKAVTEVELARLERQATAPKCPLCNTAFFRTPIQYPLAELARAVAGVLGIGDLVKVEFVLPQKG
jgi:uncharacterized paraquat-inducible protein A